MNLVIGKKYRVINKLPIVGQIDSNIDPYLNTQINDILELLEFDGSKYPYVFRNNSLSTTIKIQLAYHEALDCLTEECYNDWPCWL